MTKNDRARDYDSFVALFSIERIRDINSTVREVIKALFRIKINVWLYITIDSLSIIWQSKL